MKNIDRKIIIGYFCLVGFSILLIALVFLTSNNLITQDAEANMEELSGLECVMPDAYTIRLTGTLPDRVARDGALGIYSIHQYVTVSVEEKEIYQFGTQNTFFENTPGSIWNFIPVSGKDAGSTIEILLYSPYVQTGNIVPTIYIGSEKDMIISLFQKAMVEIVLCSMILILGIVMLLYWTFLQIKTHAVDRKLLYLGTLATMFGIWSLNEVDMGAYVIENRIASVYISYTSIMLLVIPFTLFMKSLFADKKHPVWYVICIVSLLDYIICVSLQLLHILDFRESLILTHVLIAVFTVISVIMIRKEVKKGNLTRIMKINIVMLLINFFGIMMDLINYYQRVGDSSVFGRICFLLYISVLGYTATRENTELMNKGREAEIYHKLAFVDALTGLHNRAALSHDFTSCKGKNLEKSSIIMCDLNNLKSCNDTLGHHTGDRYIIMAAEAIKDTFEPYGLCYRIGGDEFCVLLTGIEEEREKELIGQLKVKTKRIGEAIAGCNADIAYGIDRYRPGDTDVYAILKRADEKMYQKKKELKLTDYNEKNVDKQ